MKKSSYHQFKTHYPNPYDLRAPFCNTKVYNFHSSFEFSEIDCKLCKMALQKLIDLKKKENLKEVAP